MGQVKICLAIDKENRVLTARSAHGSASKKSSQSRAFSYIDGKIGVGDKKCWNEGNWIGRW